MTYDRIVEWADGYPTEESLDRLRRTEPTYGNAAACIRVELAECAAQCCASYDEEPTVGRAFFSTGGWSGAEDLIGAMLGHFWIKHRHLDWRRGGHYVFDISPAKGDAA